MAGLANFPTALQGLLQQGFLIREMEEGLDSTPAYRKLAIQETFPGRIGETMTRTRKGRKAPVSTPIDPTLVNSDLNNGMVVGGNPWSIEQYVFSLNEYADTLDLNLMQDQFGIADQFLANARNNGVQASQSLERICRKRLFGAYLSGNTRVIVQPGASIIAPDGSANAASIANGATGNVNVDDIRGFTTLLVNGKIDVPSVTNPLAMTVIKPDGTTYNVQIEAAAVAHGYETGKSALDITTTPDASPGAMTIKNLSAGTWTVAAGDSIIANNAPAIFRPNARTNSAQLTGGDSFSMSLVEDAVAYLRDNGVPPQEDGTYHCILDNTSMRQLYADPDFKHLYAGRDQSAEFKNLDIVRLAGVTFIPTTEAYVQNPFGGGSGPRIRRPIIAGAECIIQGNFEGMMTWLSQRGFDRSDSNIAMVDGVVQIVREPLDRLQQFVAMSWTWIGDYAVPTDMTATSTVIPTASNALYKRCVVIEHAG